MVNYKHTYWLLCSIDIIMTKSYIISIFHNNNEDPLQFWTSNTIKTNSIFVYTKT